MGSVKSVSSVREKTPTSHASSPIEVTSHTTPLSIRRGVGGEAALLLAPHSSNPTLPSAFCSVPS